MRPDDNKNNNSKKDNSVNQITHGTITEQVNKITNEMKNCNINTASNKDILDTMKYFRIRLDKTEDTPLKTPLGESLWQSISFVENNFWNKLDENLINEGIQNFVELNPDCVLYYKKDPNPIPQKDIGNFKNAQIFFKTPSENKYRSNKRSRITIALLPKTSKKLTQILDALYQTLKQHPDVYSFKIVNTNMRNFFTRRDQIVMYTNTSVPQKLDEIISYISERLPADIPESPGPYFLKKEGHGIWSGPNNGKSIREIGSFCILGVTFTKRYDNSGDVVTRFNNALTTQFVGISCNNGYFEYNKAKHK